VGFVTVAVYVIGYTESLAFNAVVTGGCIMEAPIHDLSELFKQLGLPNGAAAIRRFCGDHYLPPKENLADAQFWSTAQSQFLREAWLQDADWVALIDQLDARLRH
jgi:hypothetical protein